MDESHPPDNPMKQINRALGLFLLCFGIIVLLAVLLTFNSIAVLIRQKFQKPLS